MVSFYLLTQNLKIKLIEMKYIFKLKIVEEHIQSIFKVIQPMNQKSINNCHKLLQQLFKK
jgi:hypothetical protein